MGRKPLTQRILDQLRGRPDALPPHVEAEEGPEGERPASLRDGIAALEVALRDSRRRTEDLEARLAALSLRAELATRLEGQISTARDEIGRLVQRLTALEAGANQYTALMTMERRLDGLESGLNAAQLPRDVLAGITSRLDGMDADLQGQYATLAETDRRLDGSLEQLRALTGSLAGHLEGTQGWDARLAALEQGGETSAQAVQGLGDRLTGLAQRVDAGQQGQERLGSAQLQQGSGLDAVGARVLALETAHAQGGEVRQALEQVRDELDRLQQGLRGLNGEEAGIRQGLAEMAVQVRELRAQADLVADQVATLEEEAGRLEALEVGTSRLDERLDEQETALAALPTRLKALEQSAAGLAGRLTDEVQQWHDREAEVRATAEHLATLTSGLERNGLDLTALKVRIDELQRSGEHLAQGLPQALDQVADLLRRDAERAQGLEAAREQIGGLAAALETFTAAAATTSKRERQSRERDIGTLRSGLRVAGWSGVVVTLVVIALSMGGYLLSDRKQEAQWQALQGHMQRLDQRLSAAGGAEPQGLERLQGALEDLRMQVKTLGGRIQDLPGREAVRLAGADTEALEAQQNNLFQALDDLGRRIAGLEDRVGRSEQAGHPVAAPLLATPVPVAAQGSPSTALAAESSPPPAPPSGPAAAPPPATIPTEPAPTLAQWQEAQGKGHYTLQLLAAHGRAELEDFARRRGLGGEVAWLAPGRGQGWYVLLHGIYPSHAGALQGLRELADRLPGVKPWVRRIPKEGEIQVLQ